MRLVILLLLIAIDVMCGVLITFFALPPLNIIAVGLAATGISYILLYAYLILFGAEYHPG